MALIAYLTVTSGTGSGWTSIGSYVSISAYSPPTGYHFAYWNTSGCTPTSATSSSTRVYISGTSPSAAAGYSINTYSVTFTAGTGGTISGSSSQTVNYGAYSSYVTATPASGYYFVQWSDGNTNAYRRLGPIYDNESRTATFALSTPEITSISVSEGRKSGGTSVVITGDRFTAASAVKFGTTDAASYNVDSDEQITAVTPAHVVGTVDVSVTTSAGTGTLEDSFEFVEITQDAAGALTPSGSITKKQLTRGLSASVTPSGALEVLKTSEFAVKRLASVGTAGTLFIYQLRPTTLIAPFVQTTLNTP